jgi:8-oxo-dGTP diphosphatase
MFCSTCGARLAHLPPVTCGGCGTAHWANAKPCAGAVVTLDGRALLVRRANEPWQGRWDIPGGFCDPAEHPIATAVREVREETGMAVTVVGFIGMWMDSYLPPAPGLPDVVTLNIYYHADPEGPPEASPDPAEVDEVRWFGPYELPKRDNLAFPDQQGPVLGTWAATVTQGLPRLTALPDAAAGPLLRPR